MNNTFVRDNDVICFPEEVIDVCDNREEIIYYSFKELYHQLKVLKDSDCRDLDAYADIIELLFNIGSISFISTEQIDEYVNDKFEKHGGYTKYIRRIL